MKVRWTTDSMRLRITPTELTELLCGRPLTCAMARHGTSPWSVTVVPGASITALRSEGSAVRLLLCRADIERLADGATEGVYFATPAGSGSRSFSYFVEKDFPCAHPHAEEAREPETERFAPTESYLQRKRRPEGIAR